MTTLPPAPRPCASCPYRTDVPSGVWSEADYDKLPRYDGPTWTQPPTLFICHQHSEDDDRPRVCGGWAGCHDGDHLMALRVALAQDKITLETAEAIRDYTSPIPLFASGAEAAAHGKRDIRNPGPDARRVMDKIVRIRPEVTPSAQIPPDDTRAPSGNAPDLTRTSRAS
ncbi:DUF6283 family protein [Streptomyces albogriseolus]|uniref:DUF6283 family protein n=1 Tax=Streptomyces albogriseolus TaxID=1887 RepID=UPI0036ED2724